MPAHSKQTLALGLAGSLLCYLAHPPVVWSWLAWVAPAPWLLLVRLPQLPGRCPYLTVWLAGVAFWLAAIQWIRLPFWANIFGLFLLAAYLGLYLPLFVALSRVAVHRVRIPLWIAAPVTWTGLEWLRAHLLTGFLMASLAHTQVDHPRVIQIADVGGEYAVTFLLMLVAACVASAITSTWDAGRSERGRVTGLVGLVPAAVAVAATLAYGQWRLADHDSQTPRRVQRIALVQSDMLADWKGSPERDAAVMQQQIDLSRQAVRDSDRPVDLIVWPETMFRQPLFIRDEKNPPPQGAVHESRFTAALSDLRALARESGSALLVGIDRVLASKARPEAEDDYELLVYNAAALVDRDGTLLDTYEKMHLLPFGEFIPFAEWIPLLAEYAPISGNSLWGEGPAAFELDDVLYSPNICYETVLPHLIRRQVRETIRRASASPDVLVNLTNDAWFWGSSELDMHLACGVFRAVEMRTPLVVAANRGLSAYVTETGRVAAVSRRNRAEVLVVDVGLPRRGEAYPSFYAWWGDWLAITCLAGCLGLALVAAVTRSRPAPGTSPAIRSTE